jgi:hypothetical protein
MPARAGPNLHEEAYILDFIPSSICAVGNFECWVSVHTNGRPVKALFDSGSSLTFCRESVAKECGLLATPATSLPRAFAANGTPMEFLGRAATEMKLGEFKTDFPLLVSIDQHCPTEMIIGRDFMKRINRAGKGIGLDFQKGVIHIGSSPVAMIAPVLSPAEELLEVRAHETVDLQPRSDTLLFGCVKQPMDAEAEYLTHARVGNDTMLAVGRCLVKAIENRVPVRLLNAGNCAKRIWANSRIALLEKLQPLKGWRRFGSWCMVILKHLCRVMERLDAFAEPRSIASSSIQGRGQHGNDRTACRSQ